MDPAVAKSDAFCRLADVLEEGRPWTVEDGLRLVWELAAQVEVLHQGGRTHRAINAETVFLDSRLRPHLSRPPPPRRFGGSDNDPEFCPPELAGGSVLELPSDVEAAAAVLKRTGRQLDPQRIDVHQLGTLLCRLTTGEPEQAIATHTEAIRLDPTSERYAARARASQAKRDCDRAIADYSEAIRLDPQDPMLCLMRAMMYQLRRDESLAAEDERKMEELRK